MFNLHKWSVYEDIVICTYVVNRDNDPKTLKKLAKAMNIPFNKVAYRACNFSKLAKGYTSVWKFSKQERDVFEWVTRNRTIKFKTLL